MNKRRTFLKKIGAGIAGSLVPWKAAALSPNQSLKTDLYDENYWKKVRKLFPLSKDKIYLNTGTFGPASYRVLQEVQKNMTAYSKSGEYGNADLARMQLAGFVKVDKKEISLTHNTTEGINIAAWGLPLKAGDEVIITRQEHVGNALPWLNRAKLHGIVLKPYMPADTREENIRLIEKNITFRTRVIAIPHVTCTTGLVLPVKEISGLAKDKGIYTVIDGAHGPGSLDLDLRNIGCDVYAGCCHKWLAGPLGTGFLYVKESMLDIVQPYWVGAHTDTGWSLDSEPPFISGYVPDAHRYDFGTQNNALYAGVGAAIRLMQEIGTSQVEKRAHALASVLEERLLALGRKVTLLSPHEPASRMGMISFRPEKMTYDVFNKLALQHHFRIRTVPESNLNCIRVSTHIYNDMEEIHQFADFCRDIL